MNEYIEKRTKLTMAYLGILETLRPKAQKIFKAWVKGEIRLAYLEGKRDGLTEARKIYTDDEATDAHKEENEKENI